MSLDASHAEAGEKAEYEHVNKEPSSDGDQETSVARGVQANDIPAGYWYSFRILGSYAAILLLACALFINYTMPASAITVINAELGYSSSYIWISNASIVVTCVGTLIVGRLSDILGRRYFLIVGEVFGIVGAAIQAKATSINMLIAGSTIYGVANTTQLCFPYVLMELVPNKYRPLSQAIITAIIVPFAGFGSIIARSMISYTALGWRWVYMLNVVFNAACLILLACFYFPPKLQHLHSGWTWRTELKKLDYGGIFFYSGMSALIVIALNWGGSTYPWKDAHVLGTLVVGCVLGIIFVVYEAFMPLEQPLLPLKLLKNRGYVCVVLCGCIGQMCLFALSILWPQQIEYLYTTDNITIGWMSITTGLSLIVGEVIFGGLMRLLGNTRLQLIVASCMMFTFLAAMGGTTHKPQNYPLAFSTLAGFFSGWLDVIATVGNGLLNEPGDLGLANGFLGSMRQLIGAVSISIYVAILSNRYPVNFAKDVSAAALGAGLPSGSLEAALAAAANGTAAAFEAVPGMNATIEMAITGGVKNAWSSSFSTVYYSSLSFAGVAIICAYLSVDFSHNFTDYVNRRITGTEAENVPVERTIKNRHLSDD
ncbi:siderophore iron transporter [Niveomyces insectorum RCEF 264]|uniref:Siderophore iron transporter n=1 Tax=Niveomyces insectorum RCEF 264 TaxID=1081102 RepID=A0A162J3L9_9HYPO|nr:siderophore iron transporter [Niveomyces insectorum RCEF 264]